MYYKGESPARDANDVAILKLGCIFIILLAADYVSILMHFSFHCIADARNISVKLEDQQSRAKAGY